MTGVCTRSCAKRLTRLVGSATYGNFKAEENISLENCDSQRSPPICPRMGPSEHACAIRFSVIDYVDDRRSVRRLWAHGGYFDSLWFGLRIVQS